MARSVVLKGATRCPLCQIPPRWCICAGLSPVTLPFQVDVLMHYYEAERPSSTGHLLQRVVSGSRIQPHRPGETDTAPVLPNHEGPTWILHPAGEPLPSESPPPADLRVLLIDANWTQAVRISRALEGRGRRIRLPMSGESRYWLRAKQERERFSTFEALVFLLRALGQSQQAETLHQQFELHVYAGLLSRGRNPEAAEYLATSSIRESHTELLKSFAPRPCVRPAT